MRWGCLCKCVQVGVSVCVCVCVCVCGVPAAIRRLPITTCVVMLGLISVRSASLAELTHASSSLGESLPGRAAGVRAVRHRIPTGLGFSA